jgi:hypothetical protein
MDVRLDILSNFAVFSFSLSKAVDARSHNLVGSGDLGAADRL